MPADQLARRRYCATAKREASREEAIGSAEASRAPSPSSHAIRNELAEAIERALGRLREDYRRVVLFRHHDRYTFQEIGADGLLSRSGAEAVEQGGPSTPARAQSPDMSGDDEDETRPEDPLADGAGRLR